jgi:hypothetical protein
MGAKNVRPRFCNRATALPWALLLFGGVRIEKNAQAATVTTFDPPGSVKTLARSVNAGGDITGNYLDGVMSHGFLRRADGSIVTFDAPGAGQSGTFPVSINASGQISGSYFGPSGYGDHGFLRATDGSFTTFDAPGALQTIPTSMNDAGDITGWTSDPQGIPGGFLRSHDGAFTEFQFFGDANFINSTGVIAGGTGGSTGFIRATDGAVTTFGLPPTFNKLFVTGLNDSGTVALYAYFYWCIPLHCSQTPTHSYFRSPTGGLTSFQIEHHSTAVADINSSGQTTGTYYPQSTARGFLRNADGSIVTFDVSGNFTQAFALNDNGIVTGGYTGADNNLHGFVRTP